MGLFDWANKRLNRWEASFTPTNQIIDHGSTGWRSAASAYGTEAGSYVDHTRALGLPAIGQGIELVAGTLSTLPMKVVDSQGVEIPHALIGGRANEEQSWSELVYLLVSDAILFGDGYAIVERDGVGNVMNLYHVPRTAVNVRVDIFRNELGRVFDRRYSVDWLNGTNGPGTIVYNNFSILNVRGENFNGTKGLGIVDKYREMFGQHISNERFAAKVWGSGFTGSAVIKTSTALDKHEKQMQKTQIQTTSHGIQNAGNAIIVDGDASFEKLDPPPAESQFVDSRRFNKEEGGFSLGNPLGLMSYTSTSGVPVIPSNEDFAAYGMTTLRRWGTRVIDAVQRSFLNTDVPNMEIETQSLTVADFRARAAGYKMALDSGLYSLNEVRQMEGMPPLDHPLADDPVEYFLASTSSGGAPEGHQDTLADDENGEVIEDSSPEERF